MGNSQADTGTDGARSSAPPRNVVLPVEAVWLGLLVTVPVAFAPWLAHPFELPKAVLLRAAALALLAAALWPAPGPRLLRAVRPGARLRLGHRAPDPTLGLAAALAAVVVLATWAGIAPARSVMGSLERVGGAVTWLAYLTVFGAVARWCPGRSGRRAIRRAALAGGVPVALYGLAQWVGLDPWQWQGDASSPVGATLGRSNFVGDLMAMLVPLALAAVLAPRDVGERRASAALLALYGLVLLATTARAAWLGASVGCAVVLLARAPVRDAMARIRVRHMAAALVLAGALAVVGLLAVPRVQVPVGEPSDALARARVPSLLGWHPASPSARLTVWQWSAPRIAARPILGYGPDAAGLAFPTLWRGARVDRAHNLVLDLVLDFGLVGLALYGALVAAVLLRGRRLVRRAGRDDAVRLGALGALAAFWTATSFSFGVIATWLLHWVLLGLLANPGPDRGRQPGGNGPRHPSASPAVTALLLVLGLALQTPLLAADAYARRADSLAAAGRPGAAEAARRAVSLAPFEARYRIALGRARATWGDGSDGAGSWSRDAARQARAATQRAPRDAYVWLAAAEIQRTVGARTGDARFLDIATASFRRSAILDPRLAEAESGWGATEMLRGDAEAAVRHFEAAIAIDESDARTYLRLGDALLALHRDHEAAESFARSVGNEPELVPAWVGHGRALCRVGKRQEALTKLRHALELAPRDLDARTALEACRAGRP